MATGHALQEWFTLGELLPHVGGALPSSMAGLAEYAVKAGWRNDLRFCRLRPGKGGGYEYRFSLFPPDVQARLVLAQAPPLPAPAVEGRSNALWTEFERATNEARLRAGERLSALDAVDAITGMTRAAAVAQVAALRGIAPSSLWSWINRVKGVPRADRLPALLPRHVGRTKTASCDPRAWDALVALYLTPTGRNFESCDRRVREMAAEAGWSPVPSAKTLKRRLDREVPAAQLTLARSGAEAARRLYPAQRRDRSIFRALEAVNADGHKIDVHCKFEDGSIGRPILTVFQDLYSGLILACRIDRSENKDVVRLALSDVVTHYGIPERVYLDNGRHFASKWISGGQSTRFRFKFRDEEPEGILKALGIQAHFTTPYSGQSKPIERAFRDFCEEVAKHPSFEGAYTGNSPVNKPAHYGSRAIPIAEFDAVLRAEIIRHNTRPGRRSRVCGGRLSFQDAYAQSVADAGTLITRATAAQRRMLLLAAEGVTARKPDGAIHLFGSRFWSPELLDHMGERLVVRFDPGDLTQPIAVYTATNRLICEADAIGDVAFSDTAAARRHAHSRRDFLKHTKAALDAERRLSLDDLTAALPRLDAPQAPQPQAVRMVANGGRRRPFETPDPRAADLSAGVALLVSGSVTPFRRRGDDEN